MALLGTNDAPAGSPQRSADTLSAPISFYVSFRHALLSHWPLQWAAGYRHVYLYRPHMEQLNHLLQLGGCGSRFVTERKRESR